ncbi:nuclear transport factor 2 family protein [Murimonas intestini]|uniref:Nuclear transport factor 2 family protein n=1 Tax=Murimonas intestini TaxID=1337051 RepID=A0AB73TAA9_9FIRM|nr:nuclear transport factor 2 family protein [Murimonas intestini]MCR1838981.1 nuclear transport factor 2 family protein [Murimonas intestini]MCR1864277.1 nuclear transport factor 2 family protein [Murimonas intestini]MCR1881887.1 nuclear transport factor 2 family protein [Murimonas intestini]
MSRTADELMTHHIESMMNMKKNSNLDEALSDYSEELVAITRLDGRTRTMGHDTLTGIMRNSLSFAVKLGMDIEHAVDKLNFLYRQSTENYITLVASMPPFSNFASFTYMVENGKAVYVSGYAKTVVRMPSLGVKAHPFPTNTEAKAITDRHIANLKDHNIEALISGYAHDAVILTNLCDHPLEGKEAIRHYCEGLVQNAGAEIDAFTDPAAKITVKEAVAELSCTAFQHRGKKQCGVLTQRIRDGKIIFESLTFQNAVPVL